MKIKTLGLTLCIIGLIGGLIAYTSGLAFESMNFYKMGLLANCIQGIGLIYLKKS